MNLLTRIGTTAWAQGLRRVSCSRASCGRWLTARQLELRRVGVRMDDRWYCSYRCLLPSARARVTKLSKEPSSPTSRTAHSALGLALVRHGALSDEQYKHISQIERQSGEDTGEIAVRLAMLSEDHVAKIRATLWSCPIFPCTTVLSQSAYALPAQLLRRYSMLPLHYAPVGNTLFVGFAYEVYYEALFAIESVLGCATRPSIILPGEYRQIVLPSNAAVACASEAATYETSVELIDTLSAHAASINADHASIVRCGDLLWCRLKAGTKWLDLLARCEESMSVASRSM